MRPASLVLALLIASTGATAADLDPDVPPPESVLGRKPGSDFFLAGYGEVLEWFRLLADRSDRVALERVGETSMGRDWYVALISSPENLSRREEIFAAARRLAAGEGVGEEEARRLAQEIPAVVHIDGGLHATEVAGAQHTPLLAYRLAATRGDPTIDRILDRTLLVLWFSINPDGQDLVAAWYRRNLGTPFEVSPLPFLYQKYVGHDNNRDGYMQCMLESRVIAERTLHYAPQVFYNHHQTAPFPARIWIPPFAEPVSSNVHPLVWRWTSVFGTRMAAWLDERGMPGAIHRGTGFDNWYPGYLDNINCFRNIVAFLTETALYRYATPRFYPVEEFPRDRRDLRSEVFYASPWRGGWWRLGDAVRYMLEASTAVLDTAARYRSTLVFGRWRAATDTIRRFREEPPYGYLLRMDEGAQWDETAAAELVDVVRRNGLEVHRATESFQANGRTYPAGTLVLRTDQAFGGLLKDLFEVQRYPEIRIGGREGPLDLPYDVAGWTLPLQMHVDVDELAEPPAERWRASLEEIPATPWPRGGLSGEGPVARLPRRWNASTRAALDALRAGLTVRLAPDGDFLVEPATDPRLGEILARTHVRAKAEEPPAEDSPLLRAPRVGLIRPWVPSIDEGWTRWLLEKYGFAPVSLRPPDVRAGDLSERFDAIVIASIGSRTLRDGFARGTVPPRYAGGLGEEGGRELARFVAEGGTLVALDASASYVIDLLHLDVAEPLRRSKRDEFFCVGSLLRTEHAATGHPLLDGVQPEPVVMFDRSAVFEPGRKFRGRVVLRWPREGPILRSGLLVGADRLRGKAALLEARHGRGRAVLFGFRPQWRGQPHGTFKLLFNALWSSLLQEGGADAQETAPPPDGGPSPAQRLARLVDQARRALDAILEARGRKDGDEALAEAKRDWDGVLADLAELAASEDTPEAARPPLERLLGALRVAGAEAATLDVAAHPLAAEDLWRDHDLDALAAAARKALGGGGN